MIEFNKSTTNPALVTLMNSFNAKRTPANFNSVVNALFKARYIAPVNVSAPEEGANSTNTNIGFNLMENTEGQSFIIVFTDDKELNDWTESDNQQTLLLKFDDLLGMILADDEVEGFVINYQSHNFVVNKLMLTEIRKEVIKQNQL